MTPVRPVLLLTTLLGTVVFPARPYHPPSHPVTSHHSLSQHVTPRHSMSLRASPIQPVQLHRGSLQREAQCSPSILPDAGPHGDLCRRAWIGGTGSPWSLPTISVQQLWHVLWSVGSPYADNRYRFCTPRGCLTLAEYWYDEGLALQIDPALLLRMYHQESSYGHSGVARVTWSIGNIRCTTPYCYNDPQSGPFELYHSLFEAIDDEYRTLRQYYGMDYASLAHHWAPNGDGANNETKYAAALGG